MKYLVRLKIFDPDYTLSLTNVMLMVLIGKVAFAVVDWTQLVALFLGLVAYNAKKFLRYKTEKRSDDTEKTVAELSDRVKALTATVSLKNFKG